MKIFPAIDIKDKKCVRLIKGDFEKRTEYETSPVDQAAKYKDHGFKNCLLYTSPSPRDQRGSRMPSSA